MNRFLFKSIYLPVILIIVHSNLLFGKITLPALFSTNAVLQQNSDIEIFGTARENSVVKLTTSWDKKVYRMRSDGSGKWKIVVSTLSAGGPYSISISDGDAVVLENVMVGVVWFCGGQSNMEMPLKGFPNQPVNGSLDLIVNADKNILVRCFSLERMASDIPIEQCQGKWVLNTPNEVCNISAVAYSFAKELQNTLKVPVGIIVSAWGGTNLQCWSSMNAISQSEIDVNSAKNEKYKSSSPSALFNGMIYPVRNYKVQGMIWYQGENNVKEPLLYRKLFPFFVQGVRDLFNSENMPFYYVQIAPYFSWKRDSVQTNRDQNGALLREAHMKCLRLIPNSGIVVTLDIGDKHCIHPAEKDIIGKRLAYWALAKEYKRSGFSFSGPIYKSYRILENKIIIDFDYSEMGLSPMGVHLENFEIAGDDKIFYPAQARVAEGGKEHGQLVVSSDYVPVPVAVRYAFRNFSKASLFNVYRLPASSFRTDNW